MAKPIKMNSWANPRRSEVVAASNVVSITKAPRKKPARDEENLQKVCVEWFDLQYPKLSQRLFHIPNALAFIGGGPGRGAFLGKMQRLKSIGLRAGIPDLFLALPRRDYHGLFIEMKSATGKASDEQIQFLEDSKKEDFAAHVVRSFQEFNEIIRWYLGGA